MPEVWLSLDEKNALLAAISGYAKWFANLVEAQDRLVEQSRMLDATYEDMTVAFEGLRAALDAHIEGAIREHGETQRLVNRTSALGAMLIIAVVLVLGHALGGRISRRITTMTGIMNCLAQGDTAQEIPLTRAPSAMAPSNPMAR